MKKSINNSKIYHVKFVMNQNAQQPGADKVKESIYFDHAATSFPKPVRVMEKMCEYMKNVGCNVGRGGYAGAYSAEETRV